MPEAPIVSAALHDLFARLVTDLQSHIFGFARGLTHNDEQARDITQDVFIDAWRAAQRGQPPFTDAFDPDGIRRWLFHVAYLRAAAIARRARRIHWEPLDATPTPATDHPTNAPPLDESIVETHALREALASLTPEDAGCILLSVVYDLTAWEIAQIIGISPEAAKKRVSRAKLRLRATYLAQNAAPGKDKRP